MTTLILLALLQDKPIEERIEAFLKGDDAARTELLKLGAFAIRPLQGAREKGPLKIDALVLELKKSAAHPEGTDVVEKLDAKVRTILRGDLRGLEFVGLRKEIGLHVFLDGFATADVKTPKVSVKVENVPVHEIFDQIYAQTGLDYGIFHNAVVIGKPERLWPLGPPPKSRPLKADEVARARELIENLDDEAIEAREAAAGGLLRMGPSVVPVLESYLGRKEPEIAARCKSLIETLQRVPRGVYGPAAVERQKLTEEGEELLHKMKNERFGTIRLINLRLSAIADILLGGKEIAHRFEGESKTVISVDIEGMILFDLFSLVAQSVGADFMISGGSLVIGSREYIEMYFSGAK